MLLTGKSVQSMPVDLLTLNFVRLLLEISCNGASTSAGARRTGVDTIFRGTVSVTARLSLVGI